MSSALLSPRANKATPAGCCRSKVPTDASRGSTTGAGRKASDTAVKLLQKAGATKHEELLVTVRCANTMHRWHWQARTMLLLEQSGSQPAADMLSWSATLASGSGTAAVLILLSNASTAPMVVAPRRAPLPLRTCKPRATSAATGKDARLDRQQHQLGSASCVCLWLCLGVGTIRSGPSALVAEPQGRAMGSTGRWHRSASASM